MKINQIFSSFNKFQSRIIVSQDARLLQCLKELEGSVNEWFCETRHIAMSSSEYKDYLPVVVRHMANNYSGTRDYNAWYAWHHCHKIGVLKNGMPVLGCTPVDAEEERIDELYRLGGTKAVKAYKDVFGE